MTPMERVVPAAKYVSRGYLYGTAVGDTCMATRVNFVIKG